MENNGLYQKYVVRRADGRDGTGGDRVEARYFVLDYVHDADARATLADHARRIDEVNPELSADILAALDATEAVHGRMMAESAEKEAASGSGPGVTEETLRKGSELPPKEKG